MAAGDTSIGSTLHGEFDFSGERMVDSIGLPVPKDHHNFLQQSSCKMQLWNYGLCQVIVFAGPIAIIHI